VTEFREHPSLACVWNGTRLVPAAEAKAAEATVWFTVPPARDFPEAPTTWEALPASRLSDDTFSVCGCPVLFSGVAFGDTVRAIASGEGALAVTEVVERGGYDSARLWFAKGGDSWRSPTETLATVGCVVDVYSERLVGISWPTSTDIHASLRRLEAEGLLEFATG
jgi:hypothetical protein